MIRINKKKNPNLEGREFIDDHFIQMLANGLRQSTLDDIKQYISYALTYKNIGDFQCDDCSTNRIINYYQDCICELCEDCKTNHCSCDLDSPKKAKNFIISIAIKYLNNSQIIKLIDKLKNHKGELSSNEVKSIMNKLNKSL